jgi:hypothetical protein
MNINWNDSLYTQGLKFFNFTTELLDKVIEDNISPYLVYVFQKDLAPVAIPYSIDQKILMLCKEECFTNMVADGTLRTAAKNLISAGCDIASEPTQWCIVTWGMLHKWQNDGFKFAYPEDICAITSIDISL